MADPPDNDDPGAPEEASFSEQVTSAGERSFSDQATVPGPGAFSDQVTERAWRDPEVQGDDDPPGRDDSEFDDVDTGELSIAALPNGRVQKAAESPPSVEPAAVVDIDTTPPDRRPTGLMDPWQMATSGTGIEAEIVPEILQESRRPTVGVDPEPRSSRWKLILVLVGAVGVILAGLAAGQIWRHQKQRQAAAPPAVSQQTPELELQSVAAAKAPEPAAQAPESKPAASGTEPSGLAAGTDEARRAVRKMLFAAFRSKKLDEALELGKKLESEHHLDWEAEFLLAEAHRMAGNTRIALRRYEAFCVSFPTNSRADDAHFWAGEILRLQNQTKAAKRHYGIVAANQRSNLRAVAKRRLRGLR